MRESTNTDESSAAESNLLDHLMRPELAKTKESTSALVCRRVMEDIYMYRYVAGQRLVEAELMRRYRVGRSSVREALTRLAAEGVVVVLRHKGAVIRGATRREILEQLEVFEALITLAAKLAAKNIVHPAAKTQAKELLLRLTARSAKLNGFELARASTSFYRALLQIAGNKELLRIMLQLSVHPTKLQLAERRSQSHLFNDYRAITKCVLDGDSKGAEQAVKAHIRARTEAAEALPDAEPLA